MVILITLFFITLDFLTGTLKAIKQRDFNSTTLREGLYHKTGSLLVIVFAVLVDFAQSKIDLSTFIPIQCDFSVPFTLLLCSYIIFMEIASFIENVSVINSDFLPSKLQSYFKKLKEKGE